MAENIWQNKTVEELQALVEYHDLRYWVLNSPEISDKEYDLLVETLRGKAPHSPQLEQLKSIEVSSAVIRHEVPMLSLQKAYSFEELLKWAEKSCRSGEELLSFSPKYDGVAGNWDGRILSTRGDGREGADISSKIPMIRVESPRQKENGALFCCKRAVRGEIVMKCGEFEKHRSIFKTPRAAAAGLLGRNAASPEFELTFVEYHTHEVTLPFKAFTREKFEELCRHFSALPYPQDGMVLRITDEKHHAALGAGNHHPYGAIAYKFSEGSSEVWTKISDVVWQVNRQDVTPVALVEPVTIDNRTIRRVTLHNESFVMEHDVHAGDRVLLHLAGDVIPHIAAFEKGAERRNIMITRCPCCGAPLERRDKRLVCVNERCEAVIKAALEKLGQRLQLKGFGKSASDYLYAAGVRSREEMIDKLIFIREQGFASLPPAGKALQELLSRKIMLTEEQKLIACDIFALGDSLARTLCTRFRLETIFSHGGDTDFFRKNLPSSARAAEIAQGVVKRQELWGRIQRLAGMSREKRFSLGGTIVSGSSRFGAAWGDLDISKVRSVGNGKEICLTGRMPWLRADLFQVCRAAGYVPVEKYSSKVQLVVFADANSGSHKLRSAALAGIPTEHILDFVKRINAI